MILCCGDTLIDMLPMTMADGQISFRPYPGGGVLNTAIALARLGVETSLFSGLSSDFFGDILKDYMQSNAVNYDLSVVSDRPTTLAMVENQSQSARYQFYDEGSAARMLTGQEILKLSTPADCIFAGGISLVADPAASAFEHFIIRESNRSVIVLDPNIRPLFITNPDEHRARLFRIFAHIDILKVSDEDLEWIIPTAKSGAEAVRQLLELGIKIVFVTKGANGVQAYSSNGKMVAVGGIKTEVIDTVGAGDTFNGAMMAEFKRLGLLSSQRLTSLANDELKAVLTFACQAAALSTMRVGANPPNQDELDTFINNQH